MSDDREGHFYRLKSSSILRQEKGKQETGEYWCVCVVWSEQIHDVHSCHKPKALCLLFLLVYIPTLAIPFPPQEIQTGGPYCD